MIVSHHINCVLSLHSKFKLNPLSVSPPNHGRNVPTNDDEHIQNNTDPNNVNLEEISREFEKFMDYY